MDVVDTLRHDAMLLERDLSADQREEKLLVRLREIYTAQGIEVPDKILREGVKAMDDHRFAYSPPKDSFLARAYINRGRWGKPLLALAAIIGFAWAVNYAAFVGPKQAAAKRQVQALTVTIPASLEENYQAATSLAKSDTARERAEALYQGGLAAAQAGEADEAKRLDGALSVLAADLRQSYTVRIVSRPGEMSGVFRINDEAPGAKNYYLIVEGIDASGRPLAINITSEEDQKSKRTSIWGVRVPQSVFNAVAADKRDDQIIQNAVIGKKSIGELAPAYSVETQGGLILEW